MITLTADCPQTVKQIIESETPSFALINRLEGDDRLSVAYLVKLINEVVEYFNIGKTMNDVQVMNTAKFILAEYAQYKLDDFMLCFDRAKKGKYGIVYDRIDGHVIFEWIEKYLHERFQEVEGLRINEKKALDKKESEDKNLIGMPDYFKPLMQKKVPEAKEIEKKPVNEQQQLVNGWINEFDLEAFELNGKKFIEVGSKNMDINEYLEMRMALFYESDVIAQEELINSNRK